MGVLGSLHRCFSVFNPTTKPYSFKWKCEDTGGSPFCCLTPCGTILPGKKVEVRVDTHTGKWDGWCLLTFVILSFNYSFSSNSSHSILLYFIARQSISIHILHVWSLFHYCFSLPISPFPTLPQV